MDDESVIWSRQLVLDVTTLLDGYGSGVGSFNLDTTGIRNIKSLIKSGDVEVILTYHDDNGVPTKLLATIILYLYVTFDFELSSDLIDNIYIHFYDLRESVNSKHEYLAQTDFIEWMIQEVRVAMKPHYNI